MKKNLLKSTKQNSAFSEAIKQLFEDHYSSEDEVRPFKNGSFPVFSVGENYIAKFFPHIYQDHFSTELKALRFLQANDFKSPQVVSDGSSEGWNVILMTKLRGVPLKEVWSELSPSEKNEIVEKVGQHTKILHHLQNISSLEKPIRWTDFLQEQKKNCVLRHRKTGAKPNILDKIPEFLSSVDLSFSQEVFLHTEIMIDHIIVERSTDGLELSGFIDFEPSMIGASEYDLASIGLFVAGGDKDLWRSFLKGYGLVPDSQLHRRIMAYTLLHRYSRMSWYMDFMPKADSLEEMAEKWFGV